MTETPGRADEGRDEDIDNAPIEEPDESGDHDEGDLSGPEDNG